MRIACVIGSAFVGSVVIPDNVELICVCCWGGGVDFPLLFDEILDDCCWRSVTDGILLQISFSYLIWLDNQFEIKESTNHSIGDKHLEKQTDFPQWFFEDTNKMNRTKKENKKTNVYENKQQILSFLLWTHT